MARIVGLSAGGVAESTRSMAMLTTTTPGRVFVTVLESLLLLAVACNMVVIKKNIQLRI